MGWMADAKVTMEALAMECKRLRAEVEVANETIDSLTARITGLDIRRATAAARLVCGERHPDSSPAPSHLCPPDR